MILLQDILPLNSLINDGKILLIRHTHEQLDQMVNKNLIEEFQSFQAKPAFTQCKYIVSFIGGERNSAIFYGLFEVGEILRNERLPTYSNELEGYCIKQNLKNDFFLKLERVKKFDIFKDRLIIDWVTPRGWYHSFGDVQNKEVIKMLPKNFVRDFQV